jgi:phosphoenolpyruvate phosphomutase
MKAIILAAGRGSRLGKLTQQKPKTCLNFMGKSLLQHQIEVYRQCDINDIHIVTGYRESEIDIPGTRKWINENWEKTNMLESLFTARDILEEEVVISYGDLIFEKKILEELLLARGDVRVLADRLWTNYYHCRFDGTLGDAENLQVGEDGDLLEIGTPLKKNQSCPAQYIGLIALTTPGCHIFREVYDDLKKHISPGEKWRFSKNIDNAYMTDFLQEIVDRNHVVKVVSVEKGWLEFDSEKDVENYKKWKREGVLGDFIEISS